MKLAKNLDQLYKKHSTLQNKLKCLELEIAETKRTYLPVPETLVIDYDHIGWCKANPILPRNLEDQVSYWMETSLSEINIPSNWTLSLHISNGHTNLGPIAGFFRTRSSNPQVVSAGAVLSYCKRIHKYYVTEAYNEFMNKKCKQVRPTFDLSV